MNTKVQEETLVLEEVKDTNDLGVQLVVHNDEVNTFDHVIKSLIDICKMEHMQAEQCSIIIHHKGKYAVREGDKSTLNPMRRELVDRGIGATLE